MKAINNLLMCLFLLCTSSIYAQTINWGSGANTPSAGDINVGSSENSFIEFYFYATGSDINGGIVDVVLPYTDEVFDLTQITQLGTVNLGDPNIISGRTLRFSVANITAGQVVHYRIPHYSKTQYNGIRTGNHSVTVNIYRDNSTVVANCLATLPLTYTYNYAKIKIEDPNPMPTAQNQNLDMSFGNNNAVDDESGYTPQMFRFRLFCEGGAIDSVTVTLVFPTGDVTLTDWKIGTDGDLKVIPATQIITTTTTSLPLRTTCTVQLKKSDFPSGNGIGLNEYVPLSVDVAKNTCGVTDVAWSSTWATQTAIKNATDVKDVPCTFSASVGDGLNSSLKYVSRQFEYDNGMVCLDGSLHEFTYVITNQGKGQARNIRVSCVADNLCYLDSASIRIKKGYNGTWMKPLNMVVTSRFLATVTTINPIYAGAVQRVHVDIPQYLSPDCQDTLFISYKCAFPSDIYLHVPGITNLGAWLPRLSPYVISYTNSGGTQMNSGVYTLFDHYPAGIADGQWQIYPPATVLFFPDADAVNTLSMRMNICMFNSDYMTSAGAKVAYRITLPKGLNFETETTNDITVYKYGDAATTWPVKNFSWNTNVAGDSTVYIFELLKADRPGTNLVDFSVDIKLKNTCDSGLDQTVTGEVRMLIYPTGTVGTSDCMDVVFDWVQIYPEFSLHCTKAGVTYDYTFRRMSIGWNDDNNDGEPDYGNMPADSEKIQHTHLLANDTVQFTWKANLLEDGDSTLYAVLFSSVHHSWLAVNPVAKALTLNGYTGLLQDSLVNSKSGNIAVSRAQDGQYAYIWEISKKNGEPFSTNEKVEFSIEMRLTDNDYTYRSTTTGNINSWFYASKTSRIKGASLQARQDSVLIIGEERRGREEYPISFNYVSPVWQVSTTGEYQFNGIQENTVTRSIYIDGINQVLTPYEYRHLSTIDSLIIELPEGYVFIENSAKFRIQHISQTGVTDVSKDTVLIASDAHINSFTRKTFVFGSSVFDVNRNGSTGFSLPDNRYHLWIQSLKVSSTPGTPIGASYAKVTIYCDNHTYTQANIPLMGKRRAEEDRTQYGDLTFFYIDAGSLRAVSAGNTVQNALSSTISWMLSLQNTRTAGNACGGWLYVQGHVQNTRLIRQGGTVYTGIGDGGRWIPLPDIAPGAPLTDTLVVEYSGTDCNNQTVTVYPIFDPAQTGTGWNPYTNGSIEMTDAGFLAAQQTDMSGPKQYIYPKLTLTVQNVESRLGGYIKPLSATPVNPAAPETGNYTESEIFIDKNFPVEIAFSTFGAQGSVVNTTAQLRVPAGLQYVPDSTYIEVNGGNYKVTGSAFITELQKLDGSTDKTVILRLSDAGIAALGNNGQIPGNDTTYLRLKLKPTCDIGFSIPRIWVILNGERVCGASVITNNKEYYSSWLPLGGKSSALNIVMENPTISVSDFMCNTAATAVLKFKNQTGPTESVVVSDSLRLVVPKAIDLESGSTPVSYSLPVATGYPSGLQGIIFAEDISNRVIGDFRYLTWPMPKTYFDDLASNSEGVQSQNNEYTIQLRFSQPEDYFNGEAYAAVVTVAGLEGCPSISSEFFEKRVPVITRAPYTVWTGNDTDDWNLSSNWTNGVPGACTNAEISASSTVFPVLSDTTLRVNSIHLPEGAEIGGIPYLNYDSARVDLSITSNRWYLLSSPFMDMYSGDYILGSTRNNPAVYIRRYQSEDLWSGAAKKTASWTSSFGQTNILLTPGTGYAIWVATDENELRTFDFPKDSTSYAVYNRGGTSVAYTEDIPSRVNSYRFAFYDKFSQNVGKNDRSFDLAVENGTDASYTNLLIANPFMSHLDFNAFYSENSSKIGNAFYVWNGNSFTATNQAPAVASGDYSNRYIAPQQSFVVLRNGTATFNALHFTPAMSVANVGNSFRSAGSTGSLRSASSTQPSRLHLKVYRYGVLQSEAEIRYQPGASNGFEDASDAWTLFAEDVKKTAVLYSLVDNAAASINTLGNLNEDIALGIRTSEPGELKFEITGAESFDGDVYLIDVAKGGQVIELGTSTEYVFNNATGDIIDRFYVRIQGAGTGINGETANHGILLYQENSVLYVKSDLSDPLLGVSLFDPQGRLLLQHTAGTPGMASETSCALPIPGDERMVTVKVVSEKSQLIRKLLVK